MKKTAAKTKGVAKPAGAELMEKHPRWGEYQLRISDKAAELRELERKRFAHFLKHPNATRSEVLYMTEPGSGSGILCP